MFFEKKNNWNWKNLTIYDNKLYVYIHIHRGYCNRSAKLSSKKSRKIKCLELKRIGDSMLNLSFSHNNFDTFFLDFQSRNNGAFHSAFHVFVKFNKRYPNILLNFRKFHSVGFRGCSFQVRDYVLVRAEFFTECFTGFFFSSCLPSLRRT